MVVPVKDEADNVVPLVTEIAAALKKEPAEIIFVDDASTDGTRDALTAALLRFPNLRIIAHGTNAGQSAAIRTGVRAARGALIVTLDGDGQNDPADIPALLARYRDPARPGDVRMIAGQRVGRKDTRAKRWASTLANALRARALGDDTRDTGCGLKLMERAAYLDLPYFDHMHRFLPALMKREGYRLWFQDVSHRARQAGRSKYTNIGRALVGVSDLLGVMWLMSRRRSTGATRELTRSPTGERAAG